MAPRRTRESVIEERRASVFPLERFPPDKQAEIAAQVAAPQPPDRYFPVGPPDSPRPLAWLPSRGWYEWHWARGIDPDGRRDSISKSLRAAVIERDGYICQLCSGPVDPGDIHLDHIKPWSKGGRTIMSNLQVAHSSCNIRKGAKYVAEDQDDQA